jgi:glycosyltransferase involved in cell wall biosynthesis
MSPLHVLVFAEYGWRNGGENSWLAVANILRDRNIRFTVACPQGTEFSDHLNSINIATIDWHLHDESGVRKSQQQIRDDIKQRIQSVTPDLVHANSLASGRLVGPVAKALNVPAIGYLRDIMKISRQAMSDINCLDRVVAVSQATLDFHCENGLDRQKSMFIHNGVDLQQFKPMAQTGAIHRELGIAPDSRLLTCIGQIGLRKGTEIIIESFAELKEQFNDIALLIVGMRNSNKAESIEFEERCRNLASQTADIFWLGRRNDIDKILVESYLLLHAARQEPLGRVLLESLATGLPMIATDVGGTKEILSAPNLVQHSLVPRDSAKELASKAADLLKSNALHAEISAEFRKIAESKFDVQFCADKLGAEYKNLAS